MQVCRKGETAEAIGPPTQVGSTDNIPGCLEISTEYSGPGQIDESDAARQGQKR